MMRWLALESLAHSKGKNMPSNNRFSYVLSFGDSLRDFNEGKIDLKTLASDLAQMGVGKIFDKDNTLRYPTQDCDLEYNEMIHSMLSGEGVLLELRGFFEYDCLLDEEHDLKLLSKPYDKDMVAFLKAESDPRYFPLKNLENS